MKRTASSPKHVLSDLTDAASADPIDDVIRDFDEDAFAQRDNHAHDSPSREHASGVALSSPVEQVTVGADLQGQRLDVAMAKLWDVLSRRKAMQMIEDDLVLVNGRRARKGHRLEKGDRIALKEEPVASNFAPTPNPLLPLRVLHEDAQLLVLDKPAGTPTCPIRRDESETLVNALIARFPETLLFGYRLREPGILHRLDTDTSGVLLVARDAETFEALRHLLEEHQIEKRYLALVHGVVRAPMLIETPIRPCPGNPRVVLAGEGKGARDATSHVTKSEVFAQQREQYSLVSVRANHATRHQVRAHLASIGHPLVGDLAYGGAHVLGLARHFLHAELIAFDHPSNGARLAVRSPLPSDLQRALDLLR